MFFSGCISDLLQRKTSSSLFINFGGIVGDFEKLSNISNDDVLLAIPVLNFWSQILSCIISGLLHVCVQNFTQLSCFSLIGEMVGYFEKYSDISNKVVMMTIFKTFKINGLHLKSSSSYSTKMLPLSFKKTLLMK